MSKKELALRRDINDRIRENSDPEINDRIDRDIEARVRFYAVQPPGVVSQRIAELEREWDVDRTLAAVAAGFALTGIFFGVTKSRKWLLVPLIQQGFVLHHMVKGWCPPLPLFRAMGLRSRQEIQRELMALKVLRGDFAEVETREPAHEDHRAEQALRSVG
jgi:hypothetical protein